jgi:gas vesicle protein
MGKIKTFLTGGILGMIAGVLVAPKKGEEMRQQLKVEADKLSDKAQSTAKTLKEQAEPMIEKAKPLIEKAKEYFNKKS